MAHSCSQLTTRHADREPDDQTQRETSSLQTRRRIDRSKAQGVVSAFLQFCSSFHSMVELCELKRFVDEDDWPSDIDTRVANLDFGGDSVLFASFDPSVSTDSLDSGQLREQCRPRTDDYQVAFADSGHWQSGNGTPLTTWGRIHSTEPLDEKTASAPDIHKRRPATTTCSSTRPSSLLANFVDNRRPDPRYVDVNDNEIETSTIQKADRWRTRSSTAAGGATSAPTKPRRTFADLQKNMAPELHFLALTHEVPNLCDESAMSLSHAMLKARREGLPQLTADLDIPLPIFLQEDTPDSGIGCSGPSHIEDWASLSILLPKHVADACSFFKSNAQLLSATSQQSNNIERSRRSEPCTTCFRVRRKHVLCDCYAASTAEFSELMPRTGRPAARPALRSRELSVVGLPIYSSKRSLVEAVVEAVAAIARGEGCSQLTKALTALVADGLKDNVSVWTMIKTVTQSGPATKDVHSIVKLLDDSAKAEQTRVEIFFEELLKESSLDCWLCYVILKENTLKKLYDEGSFLVNAPTTFRSLLWRLVDSLSLIPVLESREQSVQSRSMFLGPSRIASDSRVPKSSSVPARLSSQPICRRSRIPLPLHRPKRAVTPFTSARSSPIASIIADSQQPGHLTVSMGEKVRVLSRRGSIARCSRLIPRRSQVMTGLVQIQNLSLP